MNPLSKKLFYAAIFFMLISKGLSGQTEDEIEKLNTASYKQVITFAPPSEKFLQIKLQSHKGLLRLGIEDNCYMLPDGSYVNHKSKAAYQKAEREMWEIGLGRKAYYELLRFKYMASIYEDMDKEFFTTYSNSMYEKDKNSWLAQTNLLRLANAVTAISEMPRFFCNPKEACNYDPSGINYWHRNVGDVVPWAGKRASEFKQLAAYTSYVDENLATLLNWKDSFFKNDSEEGYLVLKTFVQTYDFKNKGYWLKPRSFVINGRLFPRVYPQPNTTKERNLLSNNGKEILLPMSPEKAEVFSEKVKSLYMVLKVQIHIEGININNENLDMNYTLSSPVIELYTDDSLTNKLGELSTETLTLK